MGDSLLAGAVNSPDEQKAMRISFRSQERCVIFYAIGLGMKKPRTIWRGESAWSFGDGRNYTPNISLSVSTLWMLTIESFAISISAAGLCFFIVMFSPLRFE